MLAAEPLLTWTDPPRELLGFLASYLPLGALGFQFGVLWPALRSGGPGRDVLGSASHRAAVIGLVGTLCGALVVLIAILGRASMTGLGFTDTVILMRGPIVQRIWLLALTTIGFTLVLARLQAGWFLSAVGMLWIQLGGIAILFTKRWMAMANSLHVFGGSLWLGALFVMMVAGVGAAFATGGDTPDRDAAVGLLVRKFSAIALFGAGLLGVSGVITAWRHLHRWSSLWTTPYGFALDAKLLVVLSIVTLGYYHWRKAGPGLTTPEAVKSFKVTAWRELKLAGLVLLITSVLVSLPSPRFRPEGGPGGPGRPGAERPQGPQRGGPEGAPRPGGGDHD